MDILKFAVVGIGNMGWVHADQLFRGNVMHAMLSAVCDTDQKKLEHAEMEFGGAARCYADYRDMLAEGGFDAVIIATPHYMHTVIAMDAFEKGYHVLCEKPAGVLVKDVREMNRKAKESGRTFGLMFNQRMNPLFSTLKEYIDLGMLGEIKRFVWIVNNWYRTQYYYDSAGWRATWHGEGGGVLLNQCPHNLDLWVWIMGMPAFLQAFCFEGKYHNIAVEDDATIYAEYENGATGVFITSTGEYPGTNRLEISGTYGKAVCEDGKLKLYLLNQDERDICFTSAQAMPVSRIVPIELTSKEGKEEHLQIIQNFTNHILYDEELVAPGEEGIYSLMISNAAYLSSWIGKKVAVPVDDEEYAKYLHAKKDLPAEKRSWQYPVNNSSSEGNAGGNEYQERWKVRW